MNPSLMLAAGLLPLGVGAAFGADPALTLDPLVVTATRTPQSAAATLASVTLIERETIERQQARSLPDLLRGLPGVTLVENGGPGQSASLLLRGTDSDHLLLLIDGVRVGSATLGGAALQDLPLDAIERIEIVRGPRSSLYGSEAIGGVIQIFTRRGGGALRPRWSLGAGSLDTARLSGGLSGGGERAWFDLGASLEATEGLNACTGRAQPFAGCGVDQPDRDGYRNQSVSARGGLRLGERAVLDAHLLRTFSANDFDGSAFAGNQSR
ncbi:MAG: TonB-dependent receptor plug domain-containing protein, partial [Chromatiaceae bacterium]|nr:TonB-dependent receptor plug domain-containing protein [Chromatiaceae bacterium]